MQNIQVSTPIRAAIKTEADLERAIAQFLSTRSATVDQIASEFGRGAQALKAIDRLKQRGAIVRVGRCPTTYRAA